jgi:hypothetical protein
LARLVVSTFLVVSTLLMFMHLLLLWLDYAIAMPRAMATGASARQAAGFAVRACV